MDQGKSTTELSFNYVEPPSSKMDTMELMLQAQLDADENKYPDQSALAVVLSIPDYDCRYASHETAILVLWTYTSKPRSTFHQTDRPIRTQSIPLPCRYDIAKCQRTTIACTETLPVRGFLALVMELFVRGYSDAVFRSECTLKQLPSTATLVNIRQSIKLRKDPAEIESRILSTAARVFADRYPPASSRTLIHWPTFCLVHFHPFYRSVSPGTGATRGRAVLCAMGPYHNNMVEDIEMWFPLRWFNKRAILIRLPSAEVDFQQLMAALIKLVDDTTDTLPFGAKIIDIYPDQQLYVGWDTSNRYQKHLNALETFCKDRHSMAREYKKTLETLFSVPPAELENAGLLGDQLSRKRLLEDVTSWIECLASNVRPGQTTPAPEFFDTENNDGSEPTWDTGMSDPEPDYFQDEQASQQVKNQTETDFLLFTSVKNGVGHNIFDFMEEYASQIPFAHNTAASPMSLFSSPASFMTTSSPASFMTARSTYASPAMGLMNGQSPATRIHTIRENEPAEPSLSAPLKRLRDDYFDTLGQQNIIQPFDKELNWSGKGQHVAFAPKDPIPLTSLSSLGASLTAKVDKVLCKRIALARKTMRCSKQWTIADALREVYHLQNLRHAHIVQLVGSYLQGRNFAILMYPVADCHLGTFMEDTADMEGTSAPAQDESEQEQNFIKLGMRKSFLRQSIGCLSGALAYIHSQTTKHMDIKPQNILVRTYKHSVDQWRVYLADFGLSRTFASQDHSQTDGPTSRTPRYCAPEVFRYEQRGRAADMFSLGCVFLEILTTCAGIHPEDFADFRRGEGSDESFHANLPRVEEWIAQLLELLQEKPHDFPASPAALVRPMMHEDPGKRPTAQHIMNLFKENAHTGELEPCCYEPPEPYVAYEAGESAETASPRQGTKRPVVGPGLGLAE